MKFLIIAALAAVASGQLRDGAFQFSNLGSVGSYEQSPFVVNSRQYSTGFIPAVYRQQDQQQYVRPAVYSQYTAQPAYTNQYSQYRQFNAQPVYTNQYSQYRQYDAQPVYTNQYSQYRQFNAQPVYSQYSAKPAVYSQYSAKPAVYSQFAAQPATFTAVKQQVAEPAVFAQAQQYASAYTGPQWRILSQVQEADPTGPYRYSYATENGIQAQEQGELVRGADGQGVVAAQGAYSYTGPDGQVYSVSYTADENGFRAVGDHLPKPPPIPAEIARSLELNAREEQQEQYDDQGRRLFKK